MEQGVQGLLLSLLGQAAEPPGAALGVHPAGLPFRQGAGHAAAAAGLLHQLAADGGRWAHGHGFLIAGLAVDKGAQALTHPQAQGEQETGRHNHLDRQSASPP